jgi:predicted DNA-binding transcriptional regulator AlpA
MQIASPPHKRNAPAALRPLLTVPALAAYLRLSKGRTYELVNAGAFGTPIRLGPRGLRVRPGEVEKFLSGENQ